MPVIPTYTAEISPAGVPVSRPATSGDFGGAAGEELFQFGQTGLKQARAIADAQEQQDLIRGYRDAAKLRQRMREQLDLLKQSGETIGDKARELLEKEVGGLQEQRTTKRGRIMAQQSAAAIATDLLHEARVYDAALVGEEAKQAVNEILDANGKELQQFPSALPSLIAEQEAFVDALDVPKQVKSAMKDRLNNAAARNAALGKIRADPVQAKKDLEDGVDRTLEEHLTADDREALLNMADQRIRGLREQASIERAELARQKELTNHKTLNDALIRIFDPSDDRLTAADVTALAEQRHPDGDPLLDPSQVQGLYSLLKSQAEGGVKTSTAALLEIIPRLNKSLITPEELTEMMLSPDWAISGDDYERFMTRATEGASAVQSVRNATLQRLPGLLGVDATTAPFVSDLLAPVYGRAEALVLQREQEYKEKGKNPIEYYTDGTVEQDARQLRKAAGLDEILGQVVQQARTATGAPLRPGDEIPDGQGGRYVYRGGDPDDIANSYNYIAPPEGEPARPAAGVFPDFDGSP